MSIDDYRYIIELNHSVLKKLIYKKNNLITGEQRKKLITDSSNSKIDLTIF